MKNRNPVEFVPMVPGPITIEMTSKTAVPLQVVAGIPGRSGRDMTGDGSEEMPDLSLIFEGALL